MSIVVVLTRRDGKIKKRKSMICFFFNDPATTEIYTLSLHDALPISRGKGARTVAVVCNQNSELGQGAEIEIVAEVGPEALSGSTRMKAGTAQKTILNMLSTGAMARLGYVYGNLMINVDSKNQKLVQRGLAILEKAAGVDRQTATK